MKILHLPTSVGGNSFGLSRAERILGLKSDVLTINDNYFDYPSDIYIQFSKNKIVKLFEMIKYINKINKNYNLLHFNFGSSLFDLPTLNLDFIDLHFYKKNKKYFVTYNGCDCRQKYTIIKQYSINACSNDKCYDGKCFSQEIDQIKKRRVKKISSLCNAVFYLNPDLKQFLPDDSIFLPYTIASWNKISRPLRRYKYPIKIVHAPSQRGTKGTDYVLTTIGRINNKFPGKIDFTLIEGVRNSEAIKLYEQADILIDQLLIGWYGALSVEAMFAGCAIMVYIRESDLQFVPPQMHDDIKKTFINCTKNNLFDKLAEIIENPDILNIYSKYSFEYANTWHNPEYVASLTKREYER